ncbi:PilZ domain-containing protein [Sphingomonas sp. 37zxx]|uniref:PilZ domain-containing protein n=1 Tax=Sphingomonas sp. 37zxx TaxID=1550073 RepID=UPI00053BF1CF|nr:PilZ domain-containing protein [Sphingomonas sp. 37zxx]
MDRYAQDSVPNPRGDETVDAKRNATRDSLLLAATLRVDGDETNVRIRNLSAGGLMAEYPIALASGTPVDIDVRGIGWVGGKVAWATDGRLGIAFDSPIDPKLARKPVGAGAKTPMYLKPPLRRL